MKKPITDEKFYIINIPKDIEKMKELIKFLGDECNWEDFHFKCMIEDNINTIWWDKNSKDYTYGISMSQAFHMKITYNDLMANYLPKDTVLNDAVDEALKEVAKNEDQLNKYKKQCKGVEIDVYDVLKAFNIVNPAIQHAIKKLLAGGQRGYKDVEQDYNEAIQSIKRGIELDVQ